MAFWLPGHPDQWNRTVSKIDCLHFAAHNAGVVAKMESVTILIPVYNEALAIYELLRRVTLVELPGRQVEVVIVDDGSTDDTVARIEAFIADHPNLDKKIRYIKGLLITVRERLFGRDFSWLRAISLSFRMETSSIHQRIIQNCWSRSAIPRCMLFMAQDS